KKGERRRGGEREKREGKKGEKRRREKGGERGRRERRGGPSAVKQANWADEVPLTDSISCRLLSEDCLTGTE
ncbi:MAG: hypothetical protein ACR2OU_07065, partial [Thermomicrobiales bacterium]